MALKLRGRVSRTRVAAAALLVVALLGAGAFAGSGGFGFLSNPTPETIYVFVPTPSLATSTATTSAGGSESIAGATETEAATATPEESATSSPTATHTAAPTRTPTHRPPTPTPTPANLKFFSLARPFFYCGETTTLAVHIRNEGPGATGMLTTVHVRDTFAGGHSVAYDNSAQVPALGLGATYDVSFFITPSLGCGANHTLTLEIDPSHTIAETTHADNIDTYNYHLERAGPDLRFIDPPFADRAVCGVPFHVHMGIDNAGSESTGGAFAINVQDKVGTTLVATQSIVVAAFPAHTSRDALVSMTVGSRCGVTHILTITLDSADAIDETYEDNNTATTNYVLNNH